MIELSLKADGEINVPSDQTAVEDFDRIAIKSNRAIWGWTGPAVVEADGEINVPSDQTVWETLTRGSSV